jgi:hypothetical protein
MLRQTVAALLWAATVAWAADPAAADPLGRYGKVDVAPAKTSVYVGTVTMTMPPFVRHAGVYETEYTAKVFPYFFLNETGRISIDFSDEQLRQLAGRQAVEFKGRGVRADGVDRRVEGKATPADATSGKIKVRVFVSKRTELIFNTTYRFPDSVDAAAAPTSPSGK